VFIWHIWYFISTVNASKLKNNAVYIAQINGHTNLIVNRSKLTKNQLYINFVSLHVKQLEPTLNCAGYLENNHQYAIDSISGLLKQHSDNYEFNGTEIEPKPISSI